mgnify:CR=1 FL=1
MPNGESPELAQSLQELGHEAGEAVQALRELAHGIYPPLLASTGLIPALRQQAGRLPLDIDVRPDDLPRLDADVEAAVYFCCLEALQNVAKHAEATHVAVVLDLGEDGALEFRVEDDGAGFDTAATGPGHGLTNPVRPRRRRRRHPPDRVDARRRHDGDRAGAGARRPALVAPEVYGCSTS